MSKIVRQITDLCHRICHQCLFFLWHSCKEETMLICRLYGRYACDFRHCSAAVELYVRCRLRPGLPAPPG